MNILKYFLPTLLTVFCFVKVARSATGCLVGNALYTNSATLAFSYKGPSQSSTCGYTLSAAGRFNCFIYGGNTFGLGELNAANYSGPFQGGDYTAIINCAIDEHSSIFMLCLCLMGVLIINKNFQVQRLY